MKKSRRGKKNRKQQQPDLYPHNEKIKTESVMLVTDDGPQGEIPTKEALEQAREYGLDLVLVAPKAQPPVAKIMDYSSFKYQKQKEEKKQKQAQKKGQLKILRLSPRIGQHDLEVRAKKAREFLDKGDKVKAEIILKGREKAHADVAYEVVNDFIESIKETHDIKVEKAPKRQGARIETIFMSANE